MSELQEVDIEQELSKSENEDVPELTIKTEPLNLDSLEKSKISQSDKSMIASLVQGSPEKQSLEEGEVDETAIAAAPSLEEGEVDETAIAAAPSLEKDADDTDSEEESDDDLSNTINIEEEINKNLLKFYHPETENINFKELLTLSRVTRNKKGQIIDPLHRTLPFLTQYEKAKILGQRAKQINHGSSVFVDVPAEVIDGHTIALMELKQNKIPFIIRRPMPNGLSEYWRVQDLKILN